MKYPTVAHLDRMNEQDVFNFVAGHLLTQYAKAVRGADSCAYRDWYHNRACAIGSLIPDDLYRSEFEGQSVGTLLTNFAYIDNAFFRLLRRYTGLCVGLQRVHDAVSPYQWPHYLVQLADLLGLSPDAVYAYVPKHSSYWTRLEFSRLAPIAKVLYAPTGLDALKPSKQAIEVALTKGGLVGTTPTVMVVDEVDAVPA